MSTRADDFLRRSAWRRLERNAVRSHERALLRLVRELAGTTPEIIDALARCTPGALSLCLPGRRLLLGNVHPLAAREVLAMVHSSPPVRLVQVGRYGRLWWIAVAGLGAPQVVLATTLHIVDDRGRTGRTLIDLPALSGVD